MHRFLVFLILTVAFCAPAKASSALEDGNALLSSCSKYLQLLEGKGDASDGFAGAACVGYVTGVSDLNTVHAVVSGGKNEGFFCIPDNVPLVQKVRVLVHYLNSHPADLHLVRVILTINAFSEAFPCK
ncbi:Rap1a/Tai family immunity protein [Marinobacter daepoensis]|uniref:Rap1a/Tai family immunity protein n=1 Tax=Marinobacter daepoensis TaxID=262077 RepID=UPI0012EB1F40|nr:Rap1a/Tai family immunity protein [Marinobacter daepoensis]